MLKKVNLTDNKYIVWPSEDKLTIESLEKIIQKYLYSNELTLLNNYNEYYDVENPKITAKHVNRYLKDVTPNELVPTAYFKTVIDTMSGFMFSNITYAPKETTDIKFAKEINAILDENDGDVKDMYTGTNALCFNKAVEIVYTVGDKTNPANVRFAAIDPRQVILIYNNNIEPELFSAIRFVYSTSSSYDYEIDVIYKDEWQTYYMKDGKLREKDEPIQLFWQECPVIVYRSEIINNKSPFDQIINYINALDALLTNNANDIQKLADAILKLSTQLDSEDKRHLDEIKVIEGLSKDDIAEYITKDMSPAFREYVSKLFIKEIHKHSHTVDWFDAENATSEASGRALRIRLFDMTMYSKRIEKVYIKGLYKRIKLISDFMSINNKGEGNVEITLNRELPDNFLDLAPVLNLLTFLDEETKLKKLGFTDSEIKDIEQRKEETREKNMENMPFATEPEDKEDDSE